MNSFERQKANGITLKLKHGPVQARIRWDGGSRVTVLEGSQMRRADRAKSLEQRGIYRYDMQTALLESGVVEAVGNRYVFLSDQQFDSPSTAAEVVLGTSANGKILWVSASGETFGQLSEHQRRQ